MNQRSKSTLFLIEQLIVVAVFAVCSAACVKILATAYFSAKESTEISNAILIAESAAESYKAVSGDVAEVARLLGGTSDSSESSVAATVYYDKQWQVCGLDEASYIFRLIGIKPGNPSWLLLSGEILIASLAGEEILSLAVAARIGADAG